MSKQKRIETTQNSEKVQRLLAQLRGGKLLDPQTVKESISRMIDHGMKV